jgi:hypothetical protein
MIVSAPLPSSAAIGTSASTRVGGAVAAEFTVCEAGVGFPAAAINPNAAANPASEALKSARRAAASRSPRWCTVRVFVTAESSGVL